MISLAPGPQIDTATSPVYDRALSGGAQSYHFGPRRDLSTPDAACSVSQQSPTVPPRRRKRRYVSSSFSLLVRSMWTREAKNSKWLVLSLPKEDGGINVLLWNENRSLGQGSPTLLSHRRCSRDHTLIFSPRLPICKRGSAYHGILRHRYIRTRLAVLSSSRRNSRGIW